MCRAVGTGFDLVISKDTLKRGYVHPSRPADPARLVQLGVDDADFFLKLLGIFKSGGLSVICNFCPPKGHADRPYIPWAEGESPISAAHLPPPASRSSRSTWWTTHRPEASPPL
jgi:hypothetical protein